MGMSLQKVDDILEQQCYEKTALISMLQAIQKEAGYLPVNALLHLAERLDVPLNRVYNVATFYNAFRAYAGTTPNVFRERRLGRKKRPARRGRRSRIGGAYAAQRY